MCTTLEEIRKMSDNELVATFEKAILFQSKHDNPRPYPEPERLRLEILRRLGK